MPFPSNIGSAGGQFNLYNFRQVAGDPARPYLFLVHIPEIGTDDVVTVMARSTTLPGMTLSEVAIPFQGVPIKIAGPATFADWSCTFMCDEAHEMRRLFFKWQALAYDIGTGLQGHSHQYKSDQITVSQMARDGQIVMSYGLVGAWPKEVSQIEVAQTAGEFETFSVNFAMDYYTIVNQAGEQTNVGSFVRSTKSTQISRGSVPPAGQWKTPFKPQ